MPDPSLIIGHGRSGTNLALDLVDAHASTQCRNEPNFVAGGAIEKLFGLVNVSSRYSFDAAQWNAACKTALHSKSLRDRPSYAWKSYVSHDPASRVCQKLLPRHRVRRELLGRVLPSYAHEEFPLPGLVASKRALDQAHLVLKIGQSNQLGTHLDGLGVPYKLVHIARNPYDVVRSWAFRWLPDHDRYEVWDALYGRAVRYFDQAPHAMASELSKDLNVYELEHFHVVLGDDHLFRSMRDKAHYLMITYEYADQNRIECSKLIYDFLGLAWSAEVEQRLRDLKNELFAKLPTTKPYDRTDFMARVLAKSELRAALDGRPYFRGGQ